LNNSSGQPNPTFVKLRQYILSNSNATVRMKVRENPSPITHDSIRQKICTALIERSPAMTSPANHSALVQLRSEIEGAAPANWRDFYRDSRTLVQNAASDLSTPSIEQACAEAVAAAQKYASFIRDRGSLFLSTGQEATQLRAAALLAVEKLGNAIADAKSNAKAKGLR
jgi:hypothetical protein